MSEKIWSDDAWEDYLYWQAQDDKKTIKRIDQLIKEIERNGCAEFVSHTVEDIIVTNNYPGIQKTGSNTNFSDLNPLAALLLGYYSAEIRWARDFMASVSAAMASLRPFCCCLTALS